MSAKNIAKVFIAIAVISVVALAVFLLVGIVTGEDSDTVALDVQPQDHGGAALARPNFIEVTTQFRIPQLDLRGYELCHFEVESWFLERINYHREAFGIHPYTVLPAAAITAIEHSIDMRDNNISGNAASDGRTHQERHHRWFGEGRTRVTSSSTRVRTFNGPVTREDVHAFVDDIRNGDNVEAFLLNPTYYYIGVGLAVQANGRGRLTITMASKEGMRAAHHARTAEGRIEYREAYLAYVRENRGWVAP